MRKWDLIHWFSFFDEVNRTPMRYQLQFVVDSDRIKVISESESFSEVHKNFYEEVKRLRDTKEAHNYIMEIWYAPLGYAIMIFKDDQVYSLGDPLCDTN